jgi:hypothetical protein
MRMLFKLEAPLWHKHDYGCEIWGSHSSKDVSVVVLGCDTIINCTCKSTWHHNPEQHQHDYGWNIKVLRLNNLEEKFYLLFYKSHFIFKYLAVLNHFLTISYSFVIDYVSGGEATSVNCGHQSSSPRSYMSMENSGKMKMLVGEDSWLVQ